MTKLNNFPYKPGADGYNRQSGQKTLVLVAVCISLITLFSILSFLLIFKSH